MMVFLTLKSRNQFYSKRGLRYAISSLANLLPWSSPGGKCNTWYIVYDPSCQAIAFILAETDWQMSISRCDRKVSDGLAYDMGKCFIKCLITVSRSLNTRHISCWRLQSIAMYIVIALWLVDELPQAGRPQDLPTKLLLGYRRQWRWMKWYTYKWSLVMKRSFNNRESDETKNDSTKMFS